MPGVQDEEDAQPYIGKGLRVCIHLEQYNSSSNLVRRILDIEDFDLDQGAIDSHLVKEHEFGFS